MAKKKKLQSGFQLIGIAPNILLKDIENTAPFLFQGELNTTGEKRAFLEKLRFYKKNLKALNHINLYDYFYLCLAAHWTTAGTFVPTDVDNQIREGLWKHKDSKKFLEKMGKLTIESYYWDYSQVTNRVSYDESGNVIMSTHEGTWFSVAIGAYCALIKNGLTTLADEVAHTIMLEARKEEKLMLDLRERRDHLNFIRSAPLIAHNFGDLDRVMVAWDMLDDPFCKSIYKLGHIKNPKFNEILVYTGKVNKAFTSKENHRHMALRKPKCIRKSHDFLVPTGPLMDDWGTIIGKSSKLSHAEKAEIATALYDGFKREDEAFGYARAYGRIQAEMGQNALEAELPFDLVREIKASSFYTTAMQNREDFEAHYIKALNEFVCPETGIQF